MRKLRAKLSVLAAVAIAATAGAIAVVNASTAEAAVGPLTWSDEFDGPAGSSPNLSKWKFDTGGSGWGNNEREYYTNSTSNAALDGNGHLVITAMAPPVTASATAAATDSSLRRRRLQPGRRTGLLLGTNSKQTLQIHLRRRYEVGWSLSIERSPT